MKQAMTAAAVLTVACGQPVEQRSSRLTVVAACHFEISQAHRNGNGNYQIVATFSVVDGRISGLRIADFAKLAVDDQVWACLDGWRFGGVADGSDVEVTFQWRHGKGWTSQSVKLPNETLELTIWGNPSPYRR